MILTKQNKSSGAFPSPEPEPVLPFARLDPFELPDIMSPDQVLRVGSEDIDGFSVAVREMWVTS